MKLVYKEQNGHNKPGTQVAIGDRVCVGETHAQMKVTYFAKPHKPDSSGKVTVMNASGQESEFYVGVIGAEWIEREDQAPPAPLVNEKVKKWKIVEVEVNQVNTVASITIVSDADDCIEMDVRLLNDRKVLVECEDLITGKGKGFYLDDQSMTAILVLK